VRYVVEQLDYSFLYSFAALVAEFNHKDFPSSLISGSLPGGARIQFVLPPATEMGKIICSIRRHQLQDMTLADYEASGAFSGLIGDKRLNEDEQELLKYYKEGNYYYFLHLAMQTRKNILICGGTGTGKTTFLNACLKSISDDERLITMEDTREVRVIQPNAVHLLFNEYDESINSLNIFKTCLRLRPDRIFLSELRGTEVWPYLRAANSGHPGSLSTVHADTPEGAFNQLVFMMQQAGSTSTEEQLRRYIESIIHVVIQLRRDPSPERFMRIDEVWFRDAHF